MNFGARLMNVEFGGHRVVRGPKEQLMKQTDALFSIVYTVELRAYNDTYQLPLLDVISMKDGVCKFLETPNTISLIANAIDCPYENLRLPSKTNAVFLRQMNELKKNDDNLSSVTWLEFFVMVADIFESPGDVINTLKDNEKKFDTLRANLIKEFGNAVIASGGKKLTEEIK